MKELIGRSTGGYALLDYVSLSLRLGSRQNSIMGLSGKIVFSFSIFWKIFQLSQINFLTSGFLGLNVVIMIGLSLSSFFFILRSYN